MEVRLGVGRYGNQWAGPSWGRISHSVYELLQHMYQVNITILLLPLYIYSHNTLKYETWFEHSLIQ